MTDHIPVLGSWERRFLSSVTASRIRSPVHRITSVSARMRSPPIVSELCLSTVGPVAVGVCRVDDGGILLRLEIPGLACLDLDRSEERRVGKEGIPRCPPYHQ